MPIEVTHSPRPLNGTRRCVVVFFLGISLMCLCLVFEVTRYTTDDFVKLVATTPPSSSTSSSSTSSSSTSSSSTSSSSSSSRPSSLLWSETKNRQLLLVTQGRSGSTFTSALITHDPSVYYTFEPLYALDRKLMMRPGFHDGETYRERSQGLLQSYLTCDFMNVSASDININFHTRTSYGKTFLACQRQMNSGFNHIQCLINMVKWCRSRDVSFSKVIRFPMRWAELLLRQLPNLKILYLIRDPRAVIYSQSQHFTTLGYKWPNGLKDGASRFCSRLVEDLNQISRLKRLYSDDRIRLIRYENGAMEPLAYTRDIYKFVGLKFTDGTKNYISSLQTSSPSEDKLTYGVKRSNTTAVINKWRFSQNAFRAAKVIDDLCQSVYSKVGYIKVTSPTHVTSVTEHLFTPPETFDNLRQNL